MVLSSEQMLTALKAIGEDTRLRIVALLTHGELSVSDLVDILGQSQPRISRHLKVLGDAGVVVKHREGTWAFFNLTQHGPVRNAIDSVLAGIGPADRTIAADLDRRAVVRQRRAAAAQEYFAGIAARWDEERSLHATDDIVESEIMDAANERPFRRMVDLGTGTGRMLALLAADRTRIDRAVGLDTNHSMLAVARSHLERAGLGHVELRQGDVYSPPFDPEDFDLVIIHQVLHFLDDPARAVREAARLVSPGGRLVVVDFAPHTLEFLRTDHAHRRLGFRPESVDSWISDAGLSPRTHRTVAAAGDPTSPDTDESLTVSIWIADREPVRTASVTAHRTTAPPDTGPPDTGPPDTGRAGDVTVSFEVYPPRDDTGLAALADTTTRLARIDPEFISVTYGAGGSQRQRTIEALRVTATSGAPAAAHITCVGQSTDEIDDVLSTYARLGVGTVVALRGDPPDGVDSPYAPHPDGYQRTADLVAACVGRHRFDVAVSAYPERHPQSPSDRHDLDVLADKVAAGATCAITQMFFDIDVFARFLERVRARGIDIPIVPGVFPIHSLRSVTGFATRCGATIPTAVTERFAGHEDDPVATAEIAADLAAEHIGRLTALGIEHVHLYTLNKADLALAVCDRIGRSLQTA